uniref:Uncharacterized protein n=1 Tax=Timema monikensis TaxID=170555 RepID=A0A7R9DYS2_9NEOP|nr:unnamed protein product [Timema monikensis]
MKSVITVVCAFYKRFPIARGMTTYAVLWPSASICQQFIAVNDKLDFIQAARYGFFGCFVMAPMIHAWLGLTNTLFPSVTLGTAIVKELNHANIINDVLAENAKKEYLHFCNLKKSELQEIFRPCDQFSDEVGLDTIYGSFLIGEANYKHLWEVIKICLVLSHGNATVEGGFSVNKSLLVENMHEKTVIAQRHIHDEIQEAGGIKNIHISKKMLDYVRGARKRYHEYLEMKKQERSEEDKKKAEKRKLDIQVKDLEGKRKKLMMATEEKREAIEVELQELKKKQASLY